MSANRRLRMPRRVAIIVAVASLLSLPACGGSAQSQSESEADSLTVGFVVDPSWAQIPVAEAAGYFDQQGVDVTVINFSTGIEALQALQGGQVDITPAADVPTAAALAQSPDLRVVADGSRWHGSKIVARKDSGITDVADLDGHRIGTPIGTSAEYFATTVMGAANIDSKLVNVSPSATVTAMSRGDIDAVSVFQPYQEQVVEALGDDAVALKPTGDVYQQHSLYLAQADSVNSKSDAFKKFFAALDEAGDDLAAGDHKAIDAVAQSTQLPPQLISKVLAEFDYKLQLKPDLADVLTSMAAWARSQGNLPAGINNPNDTAMLDDSTLPR